LENKHYFFLAELPTCQVISHVHRFLASYLCHSQNYEKVYIVMMLKYFCWFVANFDWIGFVLSDTYSHATFCDPAALVHAPVTKM